MVGRGGRCVLLGEYLIDSLVFSWKGIWALILDCLFWQSEQQLDHVIEYLGNALGPRPKGTVFEIFETGIGEGACAEVVIHSGGICKKRRVHIGWCLGIDESEVSRKGCSNGSYPQLHSISIAFHLCT